MLHKHDWQDTGEKGIGVFEKQEGQRGSTVRIAVSISTCERCDAILLTPDPAYGLLPVLGEMEVI